MKSFTLLLIGINLLFNNSVIEPKITDIKAMKVIEKRTEYNGITIIPAKSYKVFLKINGETISFDKSTSELKPGQTLKYESQKTFYKKDFEFLNYSLEIKFKDSNLKNNKLKGQSKL